MKRDRLQNRIAGSVFTLPVCAFVAVAAWWLPLGGLSWEGAQGLLLTALITYALLEVSSRFHLMRIRTRMVSSVWLISATAISSMHAAHGGMVAALMLSVAHLFLFGSYEKREPVGLSFHAAFFLGVAMLFVPWFLFLVPLFLLHQLVYMRSLTLRCIFATLLGASLPGFMVLVPDLFASDLSALSAWWEQVQDFQPIGASYLALAWPQLCSWLLPLLLILLGGLHFLATSYNDKISVRMNFYVLFVHSLFFQLLILFQPQHAEQLLPSMLVCGSPLVAHFFALTGSRFTNFLFILSLAAYIALAAWSV